MTPDRFASLGDMSAEDREILTDLLHRADSSAVAETRIGRRSRRDRAPLSFLQRRLWVADQLKRGDPAYNLPVAFRLSGALDVAALEASLTEVVGRHEVLRSIVQTDGDEPYSALRESAAVPFRVIDLRTVAEGDRLVRARAEVTEDALTPFDVSKGPLLRGCLVRLGQHDHILAVTMHHIATDGWSMGVLYRELATSYAAHAQGQVSMLPELDVQYGDFAEWQSRQLTGDTLQALTNYWRGELADAPVLQLPTDRPRPAVPTSLGSHESVRVDAQVSHALSQVGREESATRFMVLLAAYVLLLSRYAAQASVVIGLPIAGRTRPEVEPLIGFFVNMLALRIRADDRLTFRELVREVRNRALGAYEHQELPFDLLVNALQIERTLDRHPVFQVTFAAQDTLTEALDLPGLRAEPFSVDTGRVRFDLEAHVLDSADGIHVSFLYSTDLFDAATIRGMLASYATLLEQCAARPERPIGAHTLVNASERSRICVEWNATDAVYPSEETVTRLVERQALARTDHVAVVCGEERLTYHELEGRANRLAHRLIGLGVEREVRVGVCLDRRVDLIVALLAVAKAGGAYVPLDPAYPEERLAYMAGNARLRLVLTESQFAGLWNEANVPVVLLDSEQEDLQHEPETAPLVSSHPDDLLYLTYTSGSTGTPKGVEIPHRGVTRLVCNTNYIRLGAEDVLLQLAPVAFDASTFEIWGALIHGATIVMYPERMPRLEELAQVVQRHGVTAMFLTTALFNQIAREMPDALALVKTVMFGGEAADAGRVREVIAAGKPLRLLNVYGPTESTTFATWFPVEAVAAEAATLPIGGPISNTRLYVLDGRGEPVPVSVPGELYIGGDGLARGYHGAPRLTADRFVPDAFSGTPGSRLYRTGDIVRWRADGAVEFIGRRDGQIKLRGFRIELGEIEAALSECPGVSGGVVTIHGEGEGRRLVAYAVPMAGTALDANAIREALRAKLPPYMVPGAIVPIVSLPLNANGKVDRTALPSPEPELPGPSPLSAPPSTPAEQALAVIWAEALRRPSVGVHDNFFEVGGDSILAIQIASRASRAGVHLSPRHFFEHQTIAELARVAVADANVAEQGALAGDVPLVPVQRWFFERDYPSPGHFLQTTLLELRAECTVAHIQAAFDLLVDHHDALRARFIRQNGAWVQQVVPRNKPVAVVADQLNQMSADLQDAEILRRSAELQAGFELSEPPLVRVAVFDLGQRGRRLFIAVHHLVVDGVSWRILLEDLQALLTDLMAGRSPRLPLKTTSISVWADGLRRYATAESMDSTREFWRARSEFPVHRLPVDSPAPAPGSAGEAMVGIELTREETDGLLQHVPAVSGVRIHNALLAAVAVTIAEWTGQGVVNVDIEGHGREEAAVDAADLSRTVGWFTSIHPVRLDLTGQADLLGLAQAVSRQMAEVPGGGLSYGVLRYLTGVDTKPGGLPPASDVSFNYLGQFDQVLGANRIVSSAVEKIAPSVGSENTSPYALEVNARVMDRRLSVTWSFNPAVHAPTTINRLAERSSAWLRQLLVRCADGVIPSFPHAQLEAARLEELEARYRRIGAVENVYPLTPLQMGMVVHSLADPASAAFITQMEITLDGEVDAPALRRAWTRLQHAHEVLRSAFAEVGEGEFRRVVIHDAALDWSDHDFASDVELGGGYEQFLADERRRGFDVARAPLMRCALVRTGAETHRLVWTHHHAILDGWSVAILLEEVFRVYADERAGRVLPPSAVRPPYGVYVDWTTRLDRSEARLFWTSALAGTSEPTRLSVDRRRDGASRTASVEVNEIERYLDDEATRRLGEYAAARRVTLGTLVHAAWAVMLSRYSGTNDVLFGTAVAGRPPDVHGIEEMIGLFLNGLPVRVVIDPETPLPSFLNSLQTSLVGIREHAQVSLADIHAWSGVPQGRPLFETTIAFENYPVVDQLDRAMGHAGVTRFRLFGHNADALHLRVVPGPRLRLMLGYDQGRFDAETAREMLEQVDGLLRQMTDGAATVADLTLVTPAASLRLPSSSAPPSVPRRPSVHEQVLARAQVDSGRTALASFDGTLTYAQLDDRSNRIAYLLGASGPIAPERVVAIHGTRCADLVCAVLGVLRSGAAFCILDAAHPATRLREYLDRSGAETVLCLNDTDPAEVFAAWRVSGSNRSVIGVEAAMSQSLPPPNICESVVPDQLAYVAFTSGSTGVPKVILGRHASLAHYANWLGGRFSVSPADRFSMLSAIGHDPLLRDVFPPLQLGATVCIPPSDVFDRPGELARWMARERISVANLTPAMGHLLEAGAEGIVLADLRVALFVGEPLTRALVSRLRTLAPGVSCVNLYGATETQQALSHFVDEGLAGDEVVPVGRGIDGVDLLVLSANRRMAGVGEVGEIWLRSPLLAGGYLGDDLSTRERFVDDVIGRGSGRAYRTGDRGRYLSDGSAVILGRLDEQVKIRGFRVEPAEVEGLILTDPQVREVAVVASLAGEGGTLVAFVVGGVDLGQLRERLVERLPGYMVPSVLAPIERLPRTATGKVDRRMLAARSVEVDGRAEPARPRTETEAALLDMWSEMLTAHAIGIQDDFFQLGGHSILAARLVARMRERFDIELRISDLFARPQIAGCAELIDQRIRERDTEMSLLIDEIKGLSEDQLQALLGDDDGFGRKETL